MPKIANNINSVATHYGFEATQTFPVNAGEKLLSVAEEEISILKSRLMSSPREIGGVSLIYNNQVISANKKLLPKLLPNFKNFNFDIVGVPNSIAEAIIIQTAIAILKEAGFKNIFVDINSIGDKSSFSLFQNELFYYYKSRVDKLHPDCRKVSKKHIFNLLACEHKECRALRKDAPKSIYFLSEHSQRHLKEVLEHFESIGVAYRINDSLVGANNYFSKTVFEIKSKNDKQKNEILLGWGGRYDELVKRITKKRDTAAVGISLNIKKVGNKNAKRTTHKKPKFYFAQIGPKAKLKSLPLIELLRCSGIPIRQNLYMDKFSDQINIAKQLKIPYTIILGQKEATENTVIVKDLRTVTQKVIGIENLLFYLKQLK